MPVGLMVQNSATGDGIQGQSADSAGVHGVYTGVLQHDGQAGVVGETLNYGFGVFGRANAWSGAGVQGYGGWGIYGQGLQGAVGVGTNGAAGFSYQNVGVLGISYTAWPGSFPVMVGAGQIGVWGQGPDAGVHGTSPVIGVDGQSGAGTGVWGHTTTGTGVRASSSSGSGWALQVQGNSMFQGLVIMNGQLVSPGYPKLAAVKVPDGSHRALYCVESPECWFEDFGRGRLLRGRARVRLDRTFAAVVRTGDYHVFLSPEGLSHGLYVSRRTRGGFEVREQHQGKSTVPFSYRIVARRKDVDALRFERLKIPAVPTLPAPPSRESARPPRASEIKFPFPARPPKLETFLSRARKTKRAGSGRRQSR